MIRRLRASGTFIATPSGLAGALLLLLVAATAALAPMLWVAPAARIDVAAANQQPSIHHLLGTDTLGRDILLRVLVASRLTLELSLAATVIGLLAGLFLGSTFLTCGRTVGRIVDAIVEMTLAFPGLLLVLFFAALFGVTTTGAVFAIGLSSAPLLARLTRKLCGAVEGRDFVAAARIAGVGRARILLRHLLPNVAEPLLVNATMMAGGALLTFAGLSFLGIGVQPPSYDWGRLLNDGLQVIYINPLAALGPGVAVVLTGLGFNLLGEAAARSLRSQEFGSLAAAPPSGEPDRGPAAGAEPASAVRPLLVARNLRVAFAANRGVVAAVRGVSFDIGKGEIVGLIGESGSGKSAMAMALARLIEAPGVVRADRLELDGASLQARLDREVRRLLGVSLAVVFQDPMSSFNPLRRLGSQMSDAVRFHLQWPREKALGEAAGVLGRVGIDGGRERIGSYPHELSGGMRQRVMLAMGLLVTPQLIIADEPTTALDAMTQSRILALLADIRKRERTSILLVSHDLGVVRRIADRVLVMYAGRIVEELGVAALQGGSRHPYTRALLASVPDIDRDRKEPLGVIAGRAPEPGDMPAGCAFAARCPYADSRCSREEPPLAAAGEGHRVACWKPLEAVESQARARRRERT